MFKEFYKAANDDIKPNTYLLSSILNRSDWKKQKNIFFRFGFTTAAAIILLALSLSNFIFKDSEKNLMKEQILPEVQNSSTYFYLSKDTCDNTKNTRKDDSLTDMSSPEITMFINNVNIATNEAASSRLYSDLSSEEQKEIDAGDYFKSIGLSLNALDLPENLSPDFTDRTTVLPDTENTFSYTGENFLTITLSSSSENVLSYLENENFEKSNFNDNNVVILFDGSFYQAYTIHKSGASIKILTDLPEDDLKKLVISILK